MTYTVIQQLRKKLADDYRYGNDVNTGDGSTLIFRLLHKNVRTSTIVTKVNDVLQVLDTDYTLDAERGIITFDSAPTLEHSIVVSYEYSAFSDDELNNILDGNNNDIPSSLLECIDILLMDASRRFDYSSGQTNYKPSQVFDNLTKMRLIIKGQVDSDSSGGLDMIDRIDDAYEGTVRASTDLSRYDNLGDADYD